MKLYHIVSTIALLAVSLPIASCSNESDDVTYDKNVTLTISSEAITIPFEGGTATIDVKSSYFWKIYGDPDWCSLSKQDGNPDESTAITITVPENDSDMPRYVRLNIKSGYESKDIIILQVGKDYTAPDRTGMESTAMKLIYSISNGWNLGNTLEAYDGSKLGTGISMETAWGNPVVTKELIDKVYEHGFDGIRIPCGWQNQIINDSDPDAPDYNKIHPDWMKRVKEVVDYCMADGKDMKVFLNMHHCDWIDGETAYKEGAIEVSEPRMFDVWHQIADAFKDYDERLIFCACNEPVASNAPESKTLRIYQQAFVNAVRSTGGKNAYRKLIVQAPCTNTDYALTIMELATDFVPDCLGIEVHFYEPILFCMGEDAEWGRAAYFWGKQFAQPPVKGIDRNSPYNEDRVEYVLPLLKEKFVEKGLPIISGEYGAMHKDLSFSKTIQAIHDQSYAYYHEYVVRKMKENGLVPFIWDTGGTIDRHTYEIGNKLQMDAITAGAKASYPIK